MSELVIHSAGECLYAWLRIPCLERSCRSTGDSELYKVAAAAIEAFSTADGGALRLSDSRIASSPSTLTGVSPSRNSKAACVPFASGVCCMETILAVSGTFVAGRTLAPMQAFNSVDFPTRKYGRFSSTHSPEANCLYRVFLQSTRQQVVIV